MIENVDELNYPKKKKRSSRFIHRRKLTILLGLLVFTIGLFAVTRQREMQFDENDVLGNWKGKLFENDGDSVNSYAFELTMYGRDGAHFGGSAILWTAPDVSVRVGLPFGIGHDHAELYFNPYLVDNETTQCIAYADLELEGNMLVGEYHNDYKEGCEGGRIELTRSN